ncbi:MAG: T9SS type A sorting domain-containing protein, partial [Chitinophagales bacterium]|nr:T9SS type A sorting domain-containing protein [Chitinophagales bacterium]
YGAQLHIYTPTGQLIQSNTLNQNVLQQRVYLHDLTNGVYFVHFTYNGQHVGTERLSVVK